MAEPNKSTDENFKTLRILDANGNRAAEASRVIEDFCRFSLGDKQLSKIAKRIRHGIRAVTSQLAGRQDCSFLSARDTQHDVGTNISVDNQLARLATADVVSANFSRLQESLRVLEEYAKLVDTSLAEKFESIRYESYEIQKTLFHLMQAQEIFSECVLCVLTDAAGSQAALNERISMLISAGVDMIQLREKHLEDRELLERALIIRNLTADGKVIFVVNDRPDICLLANADGVHVGQSDLSVQAARQIVGKKIVGVSTHSLSQAEQAVRDGADYIGVGPIFASKTKHFDQTQGCQLLNEVALQVTLPIFAIGGVSEENITAILHCGGRRIAASAGVLQADEPAAAVRRMRQALLQAGQQTAP